MKRFDVCFGEGWHSFLQDHPDTELVVSLAYGDAAGGYGVRMYQTAVLKPEQKNRGVIFSWRYEPLKPGLDEAIQDYLRSSCYKDENNVRFWSKTNK